MEHVTAYVDGYNLYFGLRAKGWKRFYWLNIQKVGIVSFGLEMTGNRFALFRCFGFHKGVEMQRNN